MGSRGWPTGRATRSTSAARTQAGATTADTVVSFAVANPPARQCPPTVALTAPAAGATVSGSVNVTAERPTTSGWWRAVPPRRGQLGAEDTTAPYSVSWNTLTATNGTHTLTARARRRRATPPPRRRTVTVTNAASTGLVAAYAFDEGTGTTVRDASPSAVNNGTVSGAVWAAGRYGGGRFDGTNDVVTVPDAASLDLTATTLEAWVNAAAVPSNWRNVVAKERTTNSMTYQLAANSNNNLPATRLHQQRGPHPAGRHAADRGLVALGRHLRRGHAAPLRERRPGRQSGPDRHHHRHHERAGASAAARPWVSTSTARSMRFGCTTGRWRWPRSKPTWPRR